MGGFIEIKQDDVVGIDPQIEQACSVYCKSKGFDGIQFKALQPCSSYKWDRGHGYVYAFTIPKSGQFGHVIFMSPQMLESINEGIKNKNSIPIYDRYTLLHELGHFYPYGRECADLDSKIGTLLGVGSAGVILSFLFRQGQGVGRANLFFDPKNALMQAYLVEVLRYGECRLLEGSPYLLLNEAVTARNASKYINTICKGILTASVLIVSTAIYLLVAKRLPIVRKFKKYTFNSEDKKLEMRTKDACEEQDADNFSLKLLSIPELEELCEFFAVYKDVPMVANEGTCHQSIHAQWIAATAELEKRGM